MKAGKLEIKLINYFVLIAFAALLIGVEFYFEMSQAELARDIYRYVSQQGLGPADISTPIAESPIIGLRDKIVVMFGVLTLVVAIVITMFVKNISIPLCKMAEVAQRINEGDLRQIVAVESHDEIGQVGAAINELTSNLQEVTAFASSTVRLAGDDIDAVLAQLERGETPDLAKVRDIKKCVLALSDFVGAFQTLEPEADREALRGSGPVA